MVQYSLAEKQLSCCIGTLVYSFQIYCEVTNPNKSGISRCYSSVDIETKIEGKNWLLSGHLNGSKHIRLYGANISEWKQFILNRCVSFKWLDVGWMTGLIPDRSRDFLFSTMFSSVLGLTRPFYSEVSRDFLSVYEAVQSPPCSAKINGAWSLPLLPLCFSTGQILSLHFLLILWIFIVVGFCYISYLLLGGLSVFLGW